MSLLYIADYGYSTIDPYDLTNISQIVFTDIDKRFSIGTIFNGFSKLESGKDEIRNARVGVSYDTILEAQNSIQSITGDDFFTIYCMPESGDIIRGALTNLSVIVPSTPLMCPKLFEYCQGQIANTVVYIKALKKIVAENGAYIFNVSDGGALTRIYQRSGVSYYPPDEFNVADYNTIDYFMFCYTIIPGYDGTADSIINGTYYCLQWIDSNDSYKVAVNMSTPSNNTLARRFFTALFSNFAPPDGSKPNPPNNPYDPINPSSPGTDPPGTFDFDSDPIPIPPIPTLSAANTGFTRIYNPTLSQVQQLAKYLWTDDSIIDTVWNHIKQFFENPMDCMIGFNLLPCPIPDGGVEEFAVMYWGTGVNMTVAASQFIDVDCGTLELERVYGSALDQSPYTKVTAFLPYIGMVQLDTDEVMGETLHVIYRIDIVSGSCVAYILVNENALYQYSGHCAITIPFSSADFSSYVSAAINIAKLVGMAAPGPGAAVASMDAVVEATQQTGRTVTKDITEKTTERNPMTGRQVTTGTVTRTESIHYPPSKSANTTQASFSGLSPANISNTVGAVMSSKFNVQHSGSFSGNSGYLGVRRPYLIIERPNMCLPENYQSMNGYPAMITMVLGDCVGYTRVQQVQLTGMWATNPEQAEILQLLKMGVVF